MLREQEANYFLRELVLGAAGWQPEELPPELEDELEVLCRLAGEARPRALVHRDFQSRNVVYYRGRYGLVDFQGARLGPAQYDLASLLHDPYVQLPWSLRQRSWRSSWPWPPRKGRSIRVNSRPVGLR